MVKKKTNSKQRILDSAVHLFNTNGFDGTSVREIAKKADVNVANIAYYFENKAGLLEHLILSYLEGYLSVIEEAYIELDNRSARECLFLLIKGVMDYQKEHRHTARFVYREMTLDTVLIREIMTTYMTKEKFFIETIFETGIAQKEFNPIPIAYTIMQLKGMITMPYSHPQYMTEVLHVMPYEKYFSEQYCREIDKWVHSVICKQIEKVQKINNPIPLPLNLETLTS